MTRTIHVAPVRRSLRVAAEPARAFEIFTTGMTRWWPRDKSINRSPITAIVIEPRAEGRWFERGEDGSECQWGKVLAWEPPGRLVLAWQISPEWQYDGELVTEVEVLFSPDGEGTLVELEHRLEGYGEAAERMRGILGSEQGWGSVLKAFEGEVG